MGTQSNYFKYFLGSLVVLGDFILLVLLMYHDIPDGTRDVINNNIGVFVGMGVTVIAYEFGSSKSSADKDILLKNSQPIPDKSVTVSETTTPKTEEPKT